jgi:nickel-type superoxide dismutase maturation protease
VRTPERRRRYRGVGLVRVAGHSMEPTLRDGDLVVVRWGGRPAPHRLVVLRHPHHDGLLVVKRASFRDPQDRRRWWVERDNPSAGSDSWTFGPISAGDILARVLVRLPRPRTRE